MEETRNTPGELLMGIREEDERSGRTATDGPNETHDDFYRRLRGRVMTWVEGRGRGSRAAEVILVAPDLFYLLVRLAGEPEISRGKRARILAAIGWFVMPFDILPEALLGPFGYLDDVAIAALVIDDLLNDTDPEVIRRHWPGDEDVLAVIQRVLDRAATLLSAKSFAKLRHLFSRR